MSTNHTDAGHDTSSPRFSSKRTLESTADASPKAAGTSAAQEEPALKKAKSSSEASSTPPTDPRLCLSSLIWEGRPIVWSVDGEGAEKYGEYVRGTQFVGELDPPVWSAERGCFVLQPKAPYSFVYKRERLCDLETGGDYDEYCAAFGDAEDVPPLVFLHRAVNTTPWAASLLGEDGVRRVAKHPPFAFWTAGEKDVPGESFRNAGSAPHVAITEPDLELHQKALDTGDGAESEPESEDSTEEDDFSREYGWRGSWTREFIQRDKERKPLGSLEKEIWEKDLVDGKLVETWGAKLKLVPVPGSVVFEQDIRNEESTHVGRLRLVSYEIKASVLEVYVKPDYLTSATF
ncbi:hypothetical protein PsYK624_001560 [Phanerochaete sordida]|uniref:Uncharacterized protein n=1 Tax=Phanerochaete sordida TaxID=48140 RepID=A0A9P3FWV3_9APHY|nr:hypothetical protein PsYK624_001560 [Phanerochaete sordida]